MIKEVELDHAFAEAFAASEEFRQWLLAGGRFARWTNVARILVSEQAAARKSAMHWWKHWWCKLPDGTENETDLLLVFEADDCRFAIHIENKPPHGRLEMKQATDYRRRAAFMANSVGWLNYSDFEVVLLAPEAFLRHHTECVAQFDRTISYEDVGQFVPLFAFAVSQA